MPLGAPDHDAPIEPRRTGFGRLFRRFTRKTTVQEDIPASSPSPISSSSSPVDDPHNVDPSGDQRARRNVTNRVRGLGRDLENLSLNFGGGGLSVRHGAEPEEGVQVSQDSSYRDGTSRAMLQPGTYTSAVGVIQTPASSIASTPWTETHATTPVPFSPSVIAADSTPSPYINSYISQPYPYQVPTPSPHPITFPSPPPTLPPPTPVPNQPTLAGRIQSLLDSINVFPRARENEAESAPSRSYAGRRDAASSTDTLSGSRGNISHPRARYDSDVLPDTSSIMVYSPLLPTDMDLVELAETVLFDSEGLRSPAPAAAEIIPPQQVEDQQYVQEDVHVHMQPSSSSAGSWTSWWPFNSFSSWSQPAPSTSPSNDIQSPSHSSIHHVPDVLTPLDAHTPIPVIYTPLPYASPLPSQSSNPPHNARLELLPNSPYGGQTPLPNIYTPLPPNSPLLSPGPQLVPLNLTESQSQPQSEQDRGSAQRIWVPSKTMLSIQAMWWGYRLYIPPPLMLYLSSASLGTARRSAILTSALTWFFNNLPVSLLPLPLQPLLVLLQSLTPVVGLVGGAIAAIWGLVESYDQGYGVILTATWLMPIALVPSTWPQEEWPVSPEARPRDLDEGPRSLDALLAQARADDERRGQASGGLPTPPATSTSASPYLGPDDERNQGRTPTTSIPSSPRSDAVSPPTSPRSTWSSPPASPMSSGSSSLASPMLGGDLTPRLLRSPHLSTYSTESSQSPVAGADALYSPHSPGSTRSQIYLPAQPASPLPSTRMDAHALSPYSTASVSVPNYDGGFVPMSFTPSHYPISPPTTPDYTTTPTALYPVGPPTHYGSAHSSPNALPSEYSVPAVFSPTSTPLSPLSAYLYASPPSHASPLPNSPALSTSSYYSAAQTPTQAFYSLPQSPLQGAHSPPNSPSRSIYSTASEQTPRPSHGPLPGSPTAQPPSSQTAYSPIYIASAEVNSSSRARHRMSALPASIPSPLAFSPPVGYGFSVFGIPPSPTSTASPYALAYEVLPSSKSNVADDSRNRAGGGASSIPVSPNSPLVGTLLQAPALGSVPLPDVGQGGADGMQEHDRDRRRRRRKRVALSG